MEQDVAIVLVTVPCKTVGSWAGRAQHAMCNTATGPERHSGAILVSLKPCVNKLVNSLMFTMRRGMF